MATGHAERLMPMIEEVMAAAGMAFRELDRIAVTAGPGTFTGTRIGVAAARALALATGAAVVSISSLELMGRNPKLAAGSGRAFAIATDARRNEVYLQLFSRFDLSPLTPPRCVALSDIASAVGVNGPIEFAGSGAAQAADAARRVGIEAIALHPDLLPDAVDMLFASSEMPVDASVSPLYLRPPDAKPAAANALLGAVP
jgi:tRNA threonylcarbamoyladenosine biosynthesis protein TsaB